MSNTVKRTVWILLAFFSFNAIAQDTTPKEEGVEETETAVQKVLSKIQISGSVDGYFRHNIASKNAVANAPATSFANQNGFALGMVNAIIGYEGKKTGFVADLVFGPRGEEAVFNSTGSSQIVNQLYAYWNVTEDLKLTVGNFNTFLGYEVISPAANFNYSTSYMFSYGPFSHTGLKADYQIDDNWSAMVAIMNPTDYTEFNPFDTYIVGAQLGYSEDAGSIYLNARYGNEGFPGQVDPTLQADITAGWNLSEDFYLGLNTTYLTTEPQGGGDASGFYGVALYPQYKTCKDFTIGLRGEYFSVYNGGLAGVIDLDDNNDGDVVAATLTGSYEIGDLILKPEFRVDTSSEEGFVNRDDESVKSLSSFVFGVVYKF